MHKYNPDSSVGSSWHPWVDGQGKKQLAIQEDETALVLYTLWHHHKLAGTIARSREDYEVCETRCGLPGSLSGRFRASVTLL